HRARCRLPGRAGQRLLALARRPGLAPGRAAHVHAPDGPRDAGSRLRGLAPRRRARPPLGKGDLRMRHLVALGLLLALVGVLAAGAAAQAPIESELTLITPVSKSIHDAALKAFAEYAR